MFHHYVKRLAAYANHRGRNVLKRPPPPIKSMASDVIIHAPATTGYFPPPITLDGQIERATATFRGSLDDTIRYSTETEVNHRETKLYKIENVTVDNGYIYKDLSAEYVSSLGSPRLQSPVKKNDGLLSSTPSGSVFFGDWVIADNLLEELANQSSIEPIKIFPHKNYEHLNDLNKVLQRSPEYIDCPTHYEKIYIPEDIGYNDSKVERLKTLRKHYAHSLETKTPSNKLIYLERGSNAAARSFSNEPEIIQYLSSIGFQIIDPSKMSVNEVIEATLDADIAIGVEGSQLCFAMLGLKEDGLLLTLQPPFRFQSSWRPRCESVGIRWGILVGFENDAGFSIPLEDVKRLLEKVM